MCRVWGDTGCYLLDRGFGPTSVGPPSCSSLSASAPLWVEAAERRSGPWWVKKELYFVEMRVDKNMETITSERRMEKWRDTGSGAGAQGRMPTQGLMVILQHRGIRQYKSKLSESGKRNSAITCFFFHNWHNMWKLWKLNFKPFDKVVR